MTFLTVSNNQFVLGDKPVLLRGAGIGNWLNLEHFMLGIPGTQTEIRDAVESVYGPKQAAEFWAQYFDIYLAKDDLVYMKSLGFNALRLPVSFSLFAPDNFDASIAVKQLDRVISLCEEIGLLAIIDLHTTPGGQNPDWHSDNVTGEYGFWKDGGYRSQVINLWGQIAKRYQNTPAVGGYDLVNEPNFFEPELNEVLVSFHNEAIRTIRRVDTNHVIFVEGNTYSRDFSMFTENLDENSAYTFHLYPFLQLPDQLDGPDAEDKLKQAQFKDVTFDHLLKTLKKPLWCGETGHPLHAPKSLPVLKKYLKLLEQYQVSWSLWPHKDARAMGLLFPKEESPWMTLMKKTTGGWSFWDSFNQDSILSVQNSDDKSLFYKNLATISTKANQRFAENLKQIPFETFMQAALSFRYDNCEKNSGLLGQLL